MQVKAVCGNTHLGGQDFTENLLKHVIRELENKNVTIPANMKPSLWIECENAKKLLSISKWTSVRFCNGNSQNILSHAYV